MYLKPKRKIDLEIKKTVHTSGKEIPKQSWTRYICHQQPDRCFAIAGKVIPLCSRCTGFYLGLIFGLILPIFVGEFLTMEIEILFIIMIIALTPMALDGFTQLFGWRKSNNILRFITGFLCSLFLGFCLIYVIFYY